ncbi:DUF4430 domain-containing protein [Romboutsia sp. 13368]|uniref:DUF4430 domain-containing protein n=1 Tax=Romboutsia sp. 13368 TaxID=2708053 RepID=UPI0025E1C932|nr:DUF4430 domain-containing protein [Romboutsia sp. 13368]
MNKKLIITLAAVLILILGVVGINAFKNKDVQEGSKTITIEYVSDADNLNKKEEIKTDEEKLGSVLDGKEGYKIENGMVLEIENIDLAGSKSEYWKITVNGEDAQVGVNDLIIKDGDVIKFERTSF